MGAKKYTKDKKMDKGLSFPTCVSVNNCCSNFSPLPSDTSMLSDGDVVKVSVGVHIDGYSACAGSTTISTENPQEATKGKRADVICAAHFASEAALRLLRPGNKSSQVTQIMSKIADIFHCNVVENIVSYQNKKYVIDAKKSILSKPTVDSKVEDVTFEENEVYTMEVVMSTGEGKPKENEKSRTTVFKRQVDVNYSLRMKAARYVFSEINKKFPTFPFTIRALEDKRGRLGLTELLEHSLLQPYPVLFEKAGEFVAHFKFTVLLLPGSINRLTVFPSLPFVSSEYKIEDDEVNRILAMGLKRKKKNKKKKKKPKSSTAQ